MATHTLPFVGWTARLFGPSPPVGMRCTILSVCHRKPRFVCSVASFPGGACWIIYFIIGMSTTETLWMPRWLT